MHDRRVGTSRTRLKVIWFSQGKTDLRDNLDYVGVKMLYSKCQISIFYWAQFGHKMGTDRNFPIKTKKPADRKVMQAFDLYTIYIGGYGWTRTTDPL